MKIYTLKITIAILMLGVSNSMVRAQANYTLNSPDNRLKIDVIVDNGVKYSVQHDGELILSPSSIAIGDIEKWGGVRVKSQKRNSRTENILSPLYKVKEFTISYNELELKLNNEYNIQFRAYDEGVAYRFVLDKKVKDLIINDELAEFNFPKDYVSYIPYSTNAKNPYCMAFQNVYTVAPLSEYKTETPSFLPITVDLERGKKMTILESDLESYPGMFVRGDGKSTALKGEFAEYPETVSFNDWRRQEVVDTRYGYIAKVTGKRSFPWRIIAVTEKDTQMPMNHLVYALASDNRIGDISWIKPGKVAWEWWNDWGIYGVNFKVGINNDTYKHYIDFASQNGIEYVVLDEGWSNPKGGDIMSVIDDIDLKLLTEYASRRDVGLILWAVMNVLEEKIEEACKYYSELGIKGFKVDFLDRDDQPAVERVYNIAKVCAKYKLMVDFHGIYKPTGINRTYPNSVNFEGLFGLEELKWSNPDMPLYDVTFPFIRMMAGPVDYTQGAMRNANKKNFRDVYNNPMSQGTRCHQLATYIVFDSPLVMLCDAPTVYRAEQECTDFITSLPVVFDNTKIIEGELGKYIVTLREVDGEWFLGGLTNWDARSVDVDFSFLPTGQFKAEIFRDGTNADRRGEDYVREVFAISNNSVIKVDMASGGGFAIRVSR